MAVSQFIMDAAWDAAHSWQGYKAAKERALGRERAAHIAERERAAARRTRDAERSWIVCVVCEVGRFYLQKDGRLSTDASMESVRLHTFPEVVKEKELMDARFAAAMAALPDPVSVVTPDPLRTVGRVARPEPVRPSKQKPQVCIRKLPTPIVEVEDAPRGRWKSVVK